MDSRKNSAKKIKPRKKLRQQNFMEHEFSEKSLFFMTNNFFVVMAVFFVLSIVVLPHNCLLLLAFCPCLLLECCSIDGQSCRKKKRSVLHHSLSYLSKGTQEMWGTGGQLRERERESRVRNCNGSSLGLRKKSRRSMRPETQVIHPKQRRGKERDTQTAPHVCGSSSSWGYFVGSSDS